MAGRHSVKTSKAPIITVIIVVLLIVIVGVVSFFISTKNNDVPITEIQQQTTIEQPTEIFTQTETDVVEINTIPTTKEQGFTSAQTEAVDIFVPTQAGEETTFFNASYSPVKAVDTFTDNECSLREVFGSSYSGGMIKFNDDGTFTDQIISSGGAYVVSGEMISATYLNDKNMKITVSNWDENIPSTLVINYGGYDVYFER